MRITQWLGFNEESSQYLLRRGELRALVNLQPRRPGMLYSRQGLSKIYGKYDDEQIVGMYRRDSLFGVPADIFCFQKIVVDRNLTAAQIDAKELAVEEVWMVRRVQGNQERVIHQLPISPNGLTNVTNFSVAEDRHGRVFLFFGHGATPMMYRPEATGSIAFDMGLPEPLVSPIVQPSGEGYFLESIDVVSGGGSYWSPPDITIDGGSPDRPAKVKGVVQAGNLVGVRVMDGGANYKSFPKVVVGTDKVGSGFRAIGLLGTDAGIQGFSGVAAGVVTGSAPLATSGTIGSNNGLEGNRIMYLSSPVTASTRTVGQAAVATDQMTVESVSGIGVGDVVTIYAGTYPPEFTPGAVFRVMAINAATRTLTLSKTWTPGNLVAYLVQFRKNSSIGYASASWSPATKKFSASIPLRTTKGAGSGAEATLSISPAANSYGIGAFSLTGYTTPATALFAFKKTGWDNYINDEYWKGSFEDKAGSKENSIYAGLQASGANYVYGYSGTVTTKVKNKSTSRRADIYWPDYSSISVWVCRGTLGGSQAEYTRVNARIYEDTPGQPYALVTLDPASKQTTTVKTGRKTSTTTRVPYSKTADGRSPVIRINLRQCPDSWITTAEVNGQFNLPSSVKEDRTDRQKWWHISGKTPRPVVDFRGSGEAIDYATIEVVDPGAGWERGTTFGIRIHQANPYDQKIDYNVAVTEPTLAGAHNAFSDTDRYVDFVFQATSPDDLTPAGPPNQIAGGQFVDVGGVGYRSGDTAAITLLSRNLDSSLDADIASFDGVLSSSGHTSEFTFAGSVQNPGAIITAIDSSVVPLITAGNTVSCAAADVLLDYSTVLSASGSAIRLDKMRSPVKNASALISGTVTPSGAQQATVNIGSTNSDFAVVGQRLRDAVSGNICTIGSIATDGANKILTVAGPTTSGARTFLPVLRFSVRAGVSQAQTITWTAEQVLAGTAEQRVTGIRIINGGRNYFAPPTILVRGGGNGYGLSVKPTVEGGKVTSCEILDPGRAFTAQPELYTDSTAATATPVMRPTMRGIYRCAYRFADRSETHILSTSVTGIRGDNPTAVTLASVEGLRPGMLLESPRLPSGTQVKSVRGNTVEINQEATGVGKLAVIVVENGGSGYQQNETITCTIQGATGYSVTVAKRQNAAGSYAVSDAVITAQGSALFAVGKIPVTFSAPTQGGQPATGYACIAAFDPSSSYDRSVVARDLSKPVSYSNFSPIVDVDAGPNESRQHSSKFQWSLPGVTPPPRADRVELWRTSGDESLVFYRVEAYGEPSGNGVTVVGDDTLSDEELFDPDRPNYAAMPVVLPNGNLNAYRFGQPRKDMAVCVAFQDRLWYAVSTSGKAANTIFYSEYDEFESCPDINELPIQQNQRATDSLTALVPFGSMLLAMQHAHTYAVTYNTDPGVDASIQMMSHRGCLHQRCWDVHENVIYAADEQGIYALTRSGEVNAISAAIRDYFNSELIDFSKRESFFLNVCPRTGILRFFCCMASQSETTPTMALCYEIERKTWWVERYPNSLSSAVAGRPNGSRINSSLYGAVDGGIFEMSPDKDHTNASLMRCEIRNGGKGYRRSPKVTCPNSKGVQLKGVVSEGRLVDVLIYAGGWDCKQGAGIDFPFSGSWQTVASHDGKPIQGVEYAPIQLDIDPPEPGGIQAVAVGQFSVTTRLARDVTVSAGQDFVRMSTAPLIPIEYTTPPLITTEDGRYITAVDDPPVICAIGSPPVPMMTQDGASISAAGSAYGRNIDGVPLQQQLAPVEVGMEAIGDFLPLNCFVSKVVGPEIFLVHADGTPVSLLGGAPRTDADGDGWAEGGGTLSVVYFRKPYYSHIPFRLATGALQILNEDLVQKGGDGLIDKSISLLYSPTESKKEVEIIEFFNDSQTPRPNVMRRDRGGPGSFQHRQDSASTVLNLARNASHLADATGVATATFASRVYADATGEDQHVQVELYGRPGAANGKGAELVPQKFVLHSMTIQGVVDAE